MKKYRESVVILLLFLGVLWLGGCSGSSSYDSSSAGNDYATSASDVSMGENQIEAKQSESAQRGNFDQAESEVAIEEEQMERKIIHEQFIEQQVQDLAQIIDELESTVSNMSGAYIESLREWKREERDQTIHRAEVIIRVPVNAFPSFLSQVEEQGNIIDRQISGQDVTEEFVDNEARLRNLKTHEERILELYQKAESIEDMLHIEQELSRIRSSIEQIEGRQKYLNHVTSSAKLTLQLFQVEETEFLTAKTETSTFQEAGLGFLKSVKGLARFGERLFVFLVTVLPYLMALLVIILPSYFIVKKVLPTLENKWKK